MADYTHIAKLYGFKCFFNENTMEVKGTTWFNDKMIDLFIWMENIYPFNDGFRIQIIEPISEEHKINRVRGVL